MEILEIKTQQAIEQSYPIVKELRESLSFQDFIFLYESARKANGYTLIGAYENNSCVAVMGYRILYDFVHGKHLYIDDLVVTEKRRSGGIGAKLLAHAESLAKNFQCKGLRLCTGIDRKNSQSFYERNNWLAKAVAYKKQL